MQFKKAEAGFFGSVYESSVRRTVLYFLGSVPSTTLERYADESRFCYRLGLNLFLLRQSLGTISENYQHARAWRSFMGGQSSRRVSLPVYPKLMPLRMHGVIPP